MPYWLFSQTKITGSFQIDGHVQRLVERRPRCSPPSPKKQTVDVVAPEPLGRQRRADRDRQAAADDAVGAEVALGHVGDVHRAAAAVAIAVLAAEELGEHAADLGALGDAVAVAAMGRGDLVGVGELHAGGDRRASCPMQRCMVPWIMPRM